MDKERKSKSETIICRCNDVTFQEVEEAIESGITDLEVLRKYLRIGMGNCQGRTCLPLLRGILARKIDIDTADLEVSRSRAPLIPIPMKFFDGEKE